MSNIVYLLYGITPLLGLIKNYVKYKQINIFLFLRTPMLYVMIDKLLLIYFQIYPRLFQIYPRLFQIYPRLLWTLIIERWLMFQYKIIYSLIFDLYHTRKQKYITKYNLVY